MEHMTFRAVHLLLALAAVALACMVLSALIRTKIASLIPKRAPCRSRSG